MFLGACSETPTDTYRFHPFHTHTHTDIQIYSHTHTQTAFAYTKHHNCNKKNKSNNDCHLHCRKTNTNNNFKRKLYLFWLLIMLLSSSLFVFINFLFFFSSRALIPYLNSGLRQSNALSSECLCRFPFACVFIIFHKHTGSIPPSRSTIHKLMQMKDKRKRTFLILFCINSSKILKEFLKCYS